MMKQLDRTATRDGLRPVPSHAGTGRVKKLCNSSVGSCQYWLASCAARDVIMHKVCPGDSSALAIT
jgi:hypothetical protein